MVFVYNIHPLFYFPRCFENCGKKVIPTDKFSLIGTCHGIGCDGVVSFTWHLLLNINGTLIVIDLDGKAVLAGLNIIMNPNLLQESQNYSLVFKASRASGASSQYIYPFVVNDRPHSGK